MFFTFSLSRPIRCCAHFKQNLLMLATDNSLTLFDLPQGKQLSDSFTFHQQIYPIRLQFISENKFVLQNKLRSILYFRIQQNQNKDHFLILLQKSVNINFVSAFTKIEFQQYAYVNTNINEQKQKQKQGSSSLLVQQLQNSRYKKHFYCLAEIDSVKFILKIKSQNGEIQQKYQYDEQENLSISFIKYFQIRLKKHQNNNEIQDDLNSKYLITAEEGCQLNLYQFPRINNKIMIDKQYFIDRKKILKLQTKSQIKIILDIELINQGNAIICLREENIAVVNLVQMILVKRIQNSHLARRIINLGLQFNNFIVISKKSIYATPISTYSKKSQLSKENQFKKLQTLQTSAISDICKKQIEEGMQIYGVCQDGKIFYLEILGNK